MLSVTVDQVLSWKPCKEYTRERIEELFAGRETVDVHDILAMDIPDTAKSWTVLREELIPADILHEFACRVAEHALLKARTAGKEPDKRSLQVIEVKRKWLQGNATDTELAAARAAADTARSAVAAVAWAAAKAAAGEAAWVAAWAVRVEEVAAAWEARAAAWEAWEAAEAAREKGEAERIGLLKKLLERS